MSFNRTYCFDALVKDRFVDKVEFAKFPNEFDVAQHFDLRNGTLLLLLRGEWALMFLKDCRGEKKIKLKNKEQLMQDMTFLN